MSAAKYSLADMSVGETKRFLDLTIEEQRNIKRSAHNYNLRTDLYFATKVKDDVLYITRLR